MSTSEPRYLAAAFLVGLMACAGAQSEPAMPPLPGKTTHGTLAGPLCGKSECTCTSDPAAAGQPSTGFKRFKVELGPAQHAMWATIGSYQLYKSVERSRACFFVDLPAGEHPVTLRAKGEGGFGAHLSVSEIGGEAPWFYQSFDFQCGAPGLCDAQGLRDWKLRSAKVEAGKYAPCGSVRVGSVRWQTGRMPDNLHPEDFFLQATMKVYKFSPHAIPGSAECSK